MRKQDGVWKLKAQRASILMIRLKDLYRGRE